MKCRECGAELKEGTGFCANCGASVIDEVEDYVPEAGQRIDLPDMDVSYSGTSASGLKYQLVGTTLPAAVLELHPGQVVYAESGGMSWMSANVKMETTSGGGFGKMIGRMFSGESLFMVEFSVKSGQGIAAFASEFPGKIIPLDLGQGQSIVVQKDAFMCAEKSVNLEIAWRKRLGAGFFGGEGFIMQRLTGPGMAFVELDGEVVEYTLEKGQTMMVDTGNVAMFEPTVDFDVQMVKGIKNIFFGGEGLFLARMSGPGRIWLQTMPMMNLVRRMSQYMPSSGGSSGGHAQSDIVGGVVRGLFSD